MRIPRARTSVVNAVFQSDGISTYKIVPGDGGLTSGTTQQFVLAGWQNNSGGSQAVCYALNFGLNTLAGLATNFNAVAQLYDMVKLRKCTVELQPTVDPRRAVQVTNGTGTYNFTTWPLQDPVITYYDADGFSPMPNVSSTGNVVCPANGDMTALLYNKPGARRHDPWRKITRTVVPHEIILIAADNGGKPGYNLFEARQGGPMGWQTVRNQNAFTGQLIIAIPYLGQDNAQINSQPNFEYSLNVRWYVSFKIPLFG